VDHAGEGACGVRLVLHGMVVRAMHVECAVPRHPLSFRSPPFSGHSPIPPPRRSLLAGVQRRFGESSAATPFPLLA
jgi:hypothetical protein